MDGATSRMKWRAGNAPLPCQGSQVDVLSGHIPTPFRYLEHGFYDQESDSKFHISQAIDKIASEIASES